MANAEHDNIKMPESMRRLSLDGAGKLIPVFMEHADDPDPSWKLSLLANRLCAISGEKLDETVSFICTPDEAELKSYRSMPIRPECADYILRCRPDVVEILAPGGPGFFVSHTTDNYAFNPSKMGFEATGGVVERFWDEGKIIPDEIILSLKTLMGR